MGEQGTMGRGKRQEPLPDNVVKMVPDFLPENGTKCYTCHVFGLSNVRRDSRKALRFYGRLFNIYVKHV